MLLLEWGVLLLKMLKKMSIFEFLKWSNGIRQTKDIRASKVGGNKK